MTGQQAIPVPPAPDRGACAWCGTETRRRLTLSKGSNRGAKNIRIAHEVWCCDVTPACKRRHEEAAA